jgi:hypothetical protein
MVVYSWQCPHNCTDSATCACDNLERALERNHAEYEARWQAEMAAKLPAYVERVARCARQFLHCHDEFPDDPAACQEWLDALQRAVDGSPAVRYDDGER